MVFRFDFLGNKKYILHVGLGYFSGYFLGYFGLKSDTVKSCWKIEEYVIRW